MGHIFRLFIGAGFLVTMLFFQNCGKSQLSSNLSSAEGEGNTLDFSGAGSSAYTLNLQTLDVHLASTPAAPPVYHLNTEQIEELIEAVKNRDEGQSISDFLAELGIYIDQFRQQREQLSGSRTPSSTPNGSAGVPPAKDPGSGSNGVPPTTDPKSGATAPAKDRTGMNKPPKDGSAIP